MWKKFRFFYLFLSALLKKEWKKLFLISAVLLSIVLAVFLFAPLVAQNLLSPYGKLIRPQYNEAVVGRAETFNPLFSRMEVEKQINSLVFRGLIKIGPTGQPEPDLADKFEVKSDTEYKFYLKKNIYWQDGEKFTASDVVYTIETSQNPLYQSEVAASFKDVDVTKVDDYTVVFHLKEPFSPFLAVLTLGIIPQHISLTNYRPVGTGEFRFIDINKDYATLESNKIRLKFVYYPTLETAETAVKLGEVHALAGYGKQDQGLTGWNNFRIIDNYLSYELVLAVFNTKDEVLEKAVRQALSLATPKGSLISDTFGKKGVVAANSLPNISSLQNGTKEKYPYNLDKANTLLTNAGWVLQDNFRYKNGKKLKVTITTMDTPEFVDSATKMQNSWLKIGVDVSIIKVTGAQLKDQIVPSRNFSVLLTSQLLSSDPDQYVLWHTTQIKESNISGITSPKIDKLLEDGRRSSDPKVRADKYQEFTRILLDEAPAIFLYYPRYTWLVSKRIQNINTADFRFPEDRFKNSSSWKINSPLI